MQTYQKYRTVTVEILPTIKSLITDKLLTDNNKEEWYTITYRATKIDERYNSSIAIWQVKHHVYTPELLRRHKIPKSFGKRGRPATKHLTDHYMINALICEIAGEVLGMALYEHHTHNGVKN